jgi:hypothetical protein
LFVFPYIFINIHVWAIKGGGNEASPEKNRYWYFTPFGCEFYIERCFSCTDMLDAYMDGCEVMLAVGRWRLTFTPYWFKALPSPIEVSLVHKGFKVMGGSRVAKQATG